MGDSGQSGQHLVAPLTLSPNTAIGLAIRPCCGLSPDQAPLDLLERFSRHNLHPHDCCVLGVRTSSRRLAHSFRQFECVAPHFPFDAHQKVEMHALGLEPELQRLARFRAKLYKHFSFEHIDKHAISTRRAAGSHRSEEHTSELQSRLHLVCRLLLEKKKTYYRRDDQYTV